MSSEERDVQRWTAKRKRAVVLEVLKSQVTGGGCSRLVDTHALAGGQSTGGVVVQIPGVGTLRHQ
jgi:hypothetical protein